MKIADLYQSVTNAIVADLEKGVASWVKPWQTGNAGGIMPVNAATKHSYNGVNIPILWHAQITRGFPTAQWMTYKQALPLDAHVRKGEQGTTVVFTKKLTFKEKDSEEEKRISMLRTYTVFNVAQIDGLVLTGGGDVDPVLYGADRHPSVHDAEPGRDEFEIGLIAGARARSSALR